MYRCDAWKTVFSNGSDDTRYGAHLLFCPATPGRADTGGPLPRCAALRVHYSQPHIGHRFQPCAPPREPPRANLLN